MVECIYQSKGCSNKVNQNIHDGTRLKFQAFEHYTVAWLEKVLGYPGYKDYRYFNFIDCMASSGLYFDAKRSKEFEEGTAIRIFKIFSGYAKKYKHLEFTVYMNDYDSQFVRCLQCNKEKYIPEDIPNLHIGLYTLDKYDFIRSIDKKTPHMGKYSKSLIVYDPYDVDFDWTYLHAFLHLDADYLITHFFPNDAKRNIHTKNEEVICRYEKAYGMKFSEIKKVFDHGNTPIERNQLFREALRKQLLKYSDKHSYAYTPVFLEHKLHIYDIIVLSYSTYGQELLKNTMYRLYRDREQAIEKNVQQEFDLFSTTEEDIYVKDRRSGISEFEFHYADEHIIKMFCEAFKGQMLTKEEFKERLRRHPYLPTNVLNMVKKVWKYEIVKREENGKTIVYYKFSERGLYE